MTRELADVDDVLADLPPSAKYVYHVLREADDERLSRHELLEETGLPERTLDEALNRCNSRGLLFLSRNPEDLRQTVATLAVD